MTTTSTEAPVRASNERVVRNGDIELAVFEYGDPTAETVVMVHGWPDSHHLWNGVIPLLTDRFHVVTYDQRGHGATTNPKGFRAFALPELAADLREVVRAVSPDRPVHLLAHDWGSIVGWEAVCEPDAELVFASFTSVSGPNLDHLGQLLRKKLARPTPGNLATPLKQLVSSGYTFLFQVPGLNRLPFTLIDEKRWRQGLRVVEGTSPDRMHFGETLRDDMVNGLRVYRANILPRLLRPRDRRTDVPVQLIVNHRDLAIRPGVYDEEGRWVSRLWRRDVQAGHWVAFSRPQVLANAVRELADHLAGAAPSRELRRSLVRREEARPFDDRLVIVTGGGSGIGRETALAFARLGAEIVVCDQNLRSAKETTALVADLGEEAHAFEVDVSDEAAVKAFAEAVRERHGVPDVVVNNAGIGMGGAFLETSSEEFQRVLDVNLNGVVYGSRAFASMMVERGLGGQIVNIASLAAFAPQQAMSAYSTSKAAVLMFSECLRAELASDSVGVTAICPGVIDTAIPSRTHITGVSEQEEAELRAKLQKRFDQRGYPPSKVADSIVKAVAKNRAVQPVAPEAWAGYLTSRVAPGVMRRFAKLDLL